MIKPLSLLFLLVAICEGFQNSFLVDALIKAGNCSQAYLVLSREGESSPRSDLYKGAVLFCMGREEEGLRWMDIARSQSSLAQEPGLSLALLEYVKSRSFSSSVLKQLLDMNFPPPKNPEGPWLLAYLTALSKEGAHREVLKNAPVVLDSQIVNLLSISHEALGSLTEWIVSNIEEKTFNSYPMDVRVTLIRLLYEKVDKPRARELFFGIINASGEAVTDLILFMGHKENKPEWIEKAYLRRVELRPHDIVTARDLASLWFSQGRQTEAESLLIQVLQINANSISVAREVAQVFLDYQREERLVEFVTAYRQKIRSPLILSDVLLHLFGSRGKEENFYTELFRRFGQEDGFLLGERILDYVPAASLTQFLKKAYSDSQIRAVRMVMSVLHKNPQFSLSSLDFNLEASIVLPAIKEGLDRNLVVASKILSEYVPYRDSSEFLKIRIEIAHRQKDYFLVDRLISGLTEPIRNQNPKLNLMWLDALNHIPGTSREAIRLFRTYKKEMFESQENAYSDSQSLVHALKHMILAGQTSEARQRLDQLKPVLSDEDFAYLDIVLSLRTLALGDALLKMRKFMENRMSSPWFVELQPFNMLLLPMRDYLDDKTLVKLVQLHFLWLSGDLEELEQGILDLSGSDLSSELDFVFEERILWLRLSAQSLRIRKSFMEPSLKEHMQKWAVMGREMFEKFPDSFYTPITVRALVQMYMELGDESSKDLILKEYLQRFPADLTAQILRSQLL
ncbi:MAG: hypothetical protein H3C47_03005 [Candidatus Cloacimonetes bacterium]|nr:hypothetical protein [Candidatus Cloacimonadota bacterium]